jgi:protein-S-isoprenylcysteine O-methyltransferase Ste14
MDDEGENCAREAPAGHPKWWKGARGEWLVVAQVILMGLVFFGPRTWSGQLAWGFPLPSPCSIVGAALMIAGGLFFLAALVRLGSGLTPLPYPKDGATLVQSGPYAIVRHPIYSSGLLLAAGWALCVWSWMTLVYVVLLFVFLDWKSRREEGWLMERFPVYRDYRRRVRKLVPFLY